MKFSIRDLLWLTVVVALAVGLWVERRKLANSVERVKELEKGYLGLKPGSYEIVPIGVPEDPTVKRFINVENVERAERVLNPSEPASNPRKD